MSRLPSHTPYFGGCFGTSLLPWDLSRALLHHRLVSDPKGSISHAEEAEEVDEETAVRAAR